MLILNKIKSNPSFFFATVASFFGLVFLLITPPFQTPDEVVHFYRSYQISTPNLTFDDSRVPIPDSLANTVSITSTDPIIRFDPSKKYDIYKTKEVATYSIESGTTSQPGYNLALGSTYGPVSYLPQSMAIFFGRVIDASPIVLMYLARLSNLVVWIMLFVVAIKTIPYRKWAVVYVGLLPMGIFQAISLGGDAIMIGLTAVFVSLILKLRQNNSAGIKKKEILLLISIMSLLVLTKQNMAVFIPLILLIPNNVFKLNKHAYIYKIIFIAVPLMLVLLWVLTSNGGSGGSIDEVINKQNPMQQASFILHNPHSYINVLWNTYFFTWGDTITRSFIGSFGWVDTPLSEWIVSIGYISLFILLFANNGVDKIKKLLISEKILIGLIITAFWMIVNLALYVFYSPVGYKIIVGVQGRYFLPILLLLIPLCASNWLKITPKAYKNIATCSSIFLLTCSMVTIYIRYYVNNV